MSMRPRLPLSHLHVFATAADHLSFREAAERLHVTPSAVSHRVRNLESLLGYALFERVDKGIHLTTAGQRLFSDIREPLRRLHEASARATRSRDDHLLTVSAAPIFATRWLMPRLKAFQRQHPDINLSLIATVDVLGFSANGIDAAIRVGDGRWPETDCRLLFHPRVAAVCHPDLVARRGRPYAADELRGQTRVENLGLPGLWEAWFGAAGVARQPAPATVQVQNAAQALEAVRSGDCVALVDLNLVAEDLEAGRVTLACEFVHRSDDGYYLVLPADGHRSAAQTAFVNWLNAEATGGGSHRR